MKHVFIVNPAAGKQDATDFVRQTIEGSGLDIDYEIYRTAAPGDATKYIKSVLKSETDKVRFYSCGGDGTLNEVVNGVVGFDNAELTVFPCGSGNDFIRYYGTYEDFSNLSELVNAKSHKIDVIKVGEKYAVNAVHFGFDSFVLKTMLKVKRKAVIGGKNAYTTGIVTALVKGMRSSCEITVDGEKIDENEFLLCTLTNGKYVGGGYKCAPKSSNRDGLLEICHVKPISRFKFLTLMSAYKNGTHLDDDRFGKFVTYKRGKEIELVGGDDFYISIDGELVKTDKCKVEVLEKALNFAVPERIFNVDTEEEKAVVL